MDLKEIQRLAAAKKTENSQLFKRLSKSDPRKLDDLVHSLHEEVFSRIDCLACANCCRTLGPRITENDITRLSKTFRIKPSKFIEDYLKIDEDGDYVFKSMPCPFLGSDNYCSVYNDRPKACREYPHTERRKFYQLLSITLNNIAICPAVFEIVEKIKSTVNPATFH